MKIQEERRSRDAFASNSEIGWWFSDLKKKEKRKKKRANK